MFPYTARVLALLLCVSPLSALAQTRVEPPNNKYSPAEDVKAGREAAAKIEQQLPIFEEGSEPDAYVEEVGRRLVRALPAEFRYPEFEYEFDVVDASDLNAFALPGGFMYVNRGMIEASRNEGEVAGVMAHELSHVALRHGTAQAGRAQGLSLPAIGGAILGAVIGGAVGSVISQGAQIGAGAFLLKYSRDAERQADILGAQIMARAGYDPRDLANVFQTIERQGGGRGGPEWLSSHPNPGNRYERIQEEARLLGVAPEEAIQDTPEFDRIQALLREMPPARSMQEIARGGAGSQGSRFPTGARVERDVPYPSRRFETYTGSDLFQVSVPANWEAFPGQDSVTFAPPGAYGDFQGQSVFTHGAIAGVARTGAYDLREAADQYVNALVQNNPYLRPVTDYRRGRIAGREALTITLAGRSNVTGREERVTVYTAQMRGGELFYMIAVAPRDEVRYYERAFDTMVRSVRLNG